MVEKNSFSTKDSWIPITESWEGTFYKLVGLVDRPYTLGKFPGELLRVSTYL